jgi:AI-2 transport protein TqsA
MRVLLGAASFVIVAAGLKAAAPLLIPLVIALFLAVVCFPLVQWLRARRVPTAGAVALTVLGIFAAFAGPGALITAAVRQFVAAAPAYQQQLLGRYDGALVWLRARGVDTAFVRDLIDPGTLFTFTVSSVSGLVTFLSVGVIVVLVAAFMLAYGAALAGPPGSRAEPATGTIARIVSDVQIYLRVKTVVSLITGMVAWSWLVILGVDFALLWGLVTFLLNYVPNIGSVIAAIPPVVLAFLQHGPTTALLVLAGYVALNQVIGSLVEPYLMGKRLRLAPLAVLVSVIVWGWIWGAAGALLSVPITMVLKIGLEHSDDFRPIARLLEGRRPEFAAPAPVASAASDRPPEP